MSDRVALKIYGERNTGTNYLTELAEKNFNADVLPGRVEGTDLRTKLTRKLRRLMPSLTDGLHEASRDRFFEKTFARNLGWKHMNPALERIGPEALATVRFLMLVKNPYAWLLSLYRKPYHVGGRDTQFEAFLDRHLPVMELRENIGSEPLLPVEVWNRKMRGYLALKDAAVHAVIMRYESFLVDEVAALRQVAADLEIPVREQFVPVGQSATQSGWNVSRSDYADYYLQERWRENLTEGAVRLINARLDQGFVAQMGYTLIDPEALCDRAGLPRDGLS